MSSRKWFVSRQSYWGVDPNESNVVEIASGGLDYANPDMLVPRYPGEGLEYEDPREAVESALNIAKQWKADNPNLVIGVAHGFTCGFTMPFEASEVEELKKWAETTYINLPKCDQCGELLKKDSTYHVYADPDLGQFCSERCAEKSLAELEKDNL